MVKAGLREANIHFSKYIKMVKEGREVLITDRGTPVAVISPLAKKQDSPDGKVRLLEEQGLLRRALKRRVFLPKPMAIAGKKPSEVIIEQREELP